MAEGKLPGFEYDRQTTVVEEVQCGFHENSAHKYTETLKLKNVTIQVLKCKICGKTSIGWKSQENTEEIE